MRGRGSTSSAKGSCWRTRSFLSLSRPWARRAQMNCVASSCYESTQAKMVMDWLYTRTWCMPSGAWGGTPWPPTHLIPTHVISFFGGTRKREWTNLSLETWLHWRGQLGVEFGKIPEAMVQKSIMKRKRGETSGIGCHPSSTWWQASCTERWCLAISSPSWPVVAWHHLAASQFIWAWLAPGPVSW